MEDYKYLKHNELPLTTKDLPDQKSKDAVGMTVVRAVVNEMDELREKYNISLRKETIVNITELIRDKYTEDVTQFRVLTSSINIILNKVYLEGFYKNETTELIEAPYIADVTIFSDNRVSGLDLINLSDLVGLMDGDLSEFPNLSKCTFHTNRLYNKDQMDMIPSISYKYVMKYLKE